MSKPWFAYSLIIFSTAHSRLLVEPLPAQTRGQHSAMMLSSALEIHELSRDCKTFSKRAEPRQSNSRGSIATNGASGRHGFFGSAARVDPFRNVADLKGASSSAGLTRRCWRCFSVAATRINPRRGLDEPIALAAAWPWECRSVIKFALSEASCCPARHQPGPGSRPPLLRLRGVGASRANTPANPSA